MAISDLIKVVPPPKLPLEIGTPEQWEAIQNDLKTRLPSDFCDYGMTYGSGYFDNPIVGQIRTNSPFGSKYRSQVDYYSIVVQEFKDEEGDEYIPYSVFPNSPGLLIWATDVHGNEFHWLTEGLPDDWPIIIRGRGDEWERYNGPMTSFLAKLFTRAFKTEVWPEAFYDTPTRIDFVQRI
ncbi:MAG: hypothetical protein WD065_04185 [Planctomycetaceae bacterium]